MENNNISPKWQGFRKLWIIVAILLFIILLIMLLADRVPWCDDCQPKPKIVEKEKLVDNPEHLARITALETENKLIAGLKQENAQIAGLKANIADLTNSSGLVAGLQAKVKALEAVDVNFENPKLMSKISLLEKENASIGDMAKRIMELEATNAETNDVRNTALMKQIDDLKAENGLIAGLQAKVKALEAIDVNFIKPEDNTELVQKINNLEVQTLKIPTLESRVSELKAENAMIPGLKAKVQALEAIDINFVKAPDNTELLQKVNNLEVAALKLPILETRIGELKAENAMIPGLKAKVKALEAIDINFVKAPDNTELLQKVNNLEVAALKLPILETRIGELKAENGMIPGLKAKVKALEAIDINFVKAPDNTELLQKVNNLEVQALKIPLLESRISELKAENGMIPGMKAKIKALESIDINFMSNDSAPASAPSMAVPDVAKLFFASGSSRFPTDVKQSMADVIVYLRANPDAKVSLAGYHDAAGNINWNRRLASKRSNRVKQTLLDAGIANSRITVQRPSQTLGTGSPEEARRVEVRVSN